MKWKNREKEFEENWANIKNMKIYIWGAGVDGKRLLKYFEYDYVTAFLDMDKEKQGDYMGVPIFYAPDALDELDCKKSCIIISLAGAIGKEIERECVLRGWEPGRNVFIADSIFLLNEFPKMYAYALNKNYFFAITINITEKCTLRCKECTMSIPYVKNPRNETLAEVAYDVDLLFEYVDMVSRVQLIGGEPLLNPELGSIIEYLYNNYREKYGEIIIYTNGTVPLNDKLKQILIDNRVRIFISDYSVDVKEIGLKQNEFMRTLDAEGIFYNVIKMDSWIQYGFRENHISNKTENEMIAFFDRCKPGCWTIHHGKLYYCYAAKMARKVLELEEDPTNFIDLRERKKISCYELLEWYEGYSEQGYVSTCRICNGEQGNANRVPVAEQII